MPTVAEWLTETRNRVGLSQRSLASKSGVSSAMVSKIESGDANPSRQMIEMLAEGMGVDPGPGLLSAGFTPSEGRAVNPKDIATPKFVRVIQDEEFGEITLRFYEGFVLNGKMVFVSSENDLTNEEVIGSRALLRAGLMKHA